MMKRRRRSGSWLEEGMSIRKIAARLQLSTRTVQKYKGERIEEVVTI